MTKRVGAILLAAGASSRMGSPKALLTWNGKPLVRHLAECFLGADVHQLVVVVAPGSVDVVKAVSDIGPRTVVENPNPERGMLSSVQYGLRALGRGAFLVCPCDLPRLNSSHVRAVINAWNEDPSAIVVPTRNGKHGHPALFGEDYYERALALNPAEGGLNRLLRINPVTEINTEDDGPFRDADTPADWAALQPQE